MAFRLSIPSLSLSLSIGILLGLCTQIKSVPIVDKCFIEANDTLALCLNRSDYYNVIERQCCWVEKKLKDENKTEANECMLIDFTIQSTDRAKFVLENTYTDVNINCSGIYCFSFLFGLIIIIILFLL